MIILRLVLLRSYNTTGNYKTVNWDMALSNNTTGNANAATGLQALSGNATG
jgi:hypothetical protein